MSEFQQVVDDIRAFLQGDDQTYRDELRALASEFREACVAVDRRLKQCNRLLAKGLRAEALHEADTEPRLLDLVTLLDFPEREDWDELVATYGLEAGPRVDLELASALNEAYAEADPLAELLRHHRLLALSRADLTRRIATLRQISELDPNNPIWDEDLRAFERARLREISSAVDAATRQRDVALLDQLAGELNDPSWRELPPEPQVRAALAAAAKIRKTLARETLTHIAEELHESFAAMDVARGRNALDRWKQVIAIAQPDRRDPLLREAEPALAWLQDQDRRDQEESDYQAAIADLEGALDDLEPREEVERLGAAVLRFERGMPDLLAHRYRARLSELEMNASRKRRLLFAAAGVVSIAVASVGIVALIQGARAREIAAAIAAVDHLISSERHESAIAYLDELRTANPAVAGAAELLERRSRAQQGYEENRTRANQFRAAIDEARQAQPSADDPPGLRLARELARTEQEKAEVTRLSQSREQDWRAVIARNDETIQPDIEQLNLLVSRLEQSMRNPSESRQLLAEARGAWIAIEARARSQGVSDQVSTLIDACASRIEQADRTVRSMTRQLELEDRMTEALSAESGRPVRELDPYLTLARTFVSEFPEAPTSRELDATLAQEPLWRAAIDWATLTRDWRALGPMIPEKPDDAQRVVEELKTYLEQHEAGPELELARRLAAVVGRPILRPEEKRELVTFLSQPIMALWVFPYRGNTLYLRNVPQGSGTLSGDSPLRVQYVTDLKLTERNIVPFPRQEDLTGIQPSAQSRLAETILEQLDSPSAEDNWVAIMVQAIESVQSDRELDPILKIALLKRLLTGASRGDLLLEEAAGPIMQRLEEIRVDSVPWMDPQDPTVRALREKASKLVFDLPAVSSMARQASLARNDLERELGIVRMPIGWLTKDDGGWTVRLAGIPSELRDAPLVVIEPSTDPAPPSWYTIGRLEGTEPRLNRTSFTSAAQGRPVFAVMAPPPVSR